MIYCNPVNVNYRYQFHRGREGRMQICREAADPSLILFMGRYYLFASMTLGVWVSDDLAHWENHRLPDELPLYDYAPDARVMGDWVYLCASRRDEICHFYRTRDVLKGPYEKIEGTFPFWDPDLFLDEDGRVYFYWGCSNVTPIWGVELDPETLRPLGEKRVLIEGHPEWIGYERVGHDNSVSPAPEEEVEAKCRAWIREKDIREETLPPETLAGIRGMFSRRPYIEGPWMTRHGDRYYLQYAAPGTEYNVYGDGVYVGTSPLGPFRLAQNNPFSFQPGGFMPGAGHGSTLRDAEGRYWHTASMRISVNHMFERRVGIWPAGFDAQGELFCNQRYGDWPMTTEGDPWREPPWMLLSVGRRMTASSCTPGHEAGKAAEENAQTWWQAASPGKEEWLEMDLGSVMDVFAVQICFADEPEDIPCPRPFAPGQTRVIEDRELHTRWKLEGSRDGKTWTVVEDKTGAMTYLSHDLVVRQEGMPLRYLRLSGMEVPYGQKPCVSGLRVFGKGDGKKPAAPVFSALRTGPMDMTVRIEGQGDALGYNILFGDGADRLYHSDLVFTPGEHRIGALITGRPVWVRVDAFNESGITEGTCHEAEGGEA